MTDPPQEGARRVPGKLPIATSDQDRRVALDTTDLRLIRLLEEDARRTAADMATILSLSASAVTRRIRRLEASGIILGYTARIDYTRLGVGIEALIELRFTGNTRPESMDRTAAQISEAVAVFTTAGNYDTLLWVRVRDIDHLRDVVDTLRGSKGVIDTRTHVILAFRLLAGDAETEQ